MKYVMFSLPTDPTPRLGILRDNRAIETSEFTSLLALVEAGPAAWQRVASNPVYADQASFPLSDVRLHAPIPRPRKNVFCLGLNYVNHMQESAAARGRQPKIPDVPVFFTK